MDVELRDFTGGPNDNYNSGDITQYQKCDNLLLNREGNLVSVPGTSLFDSAHPQLPSGQNRINSLINYNKDENLLSVSIQRLFQNGTWNEILGPSGGSALPGTSATSRFMSSQWKKHVFITSSDQTSPLKLYKDKNGNFAAVSAGLPAIATPDNFNATTVLASAITLANTLRTDLLGHFADIVAHFSADTVSQAILSAGACTNLATLLTLVGELEKSYTTHINDAKLSLPVYHQSVVPLAVENLTYYYYLNKTTAPTTLAEAVAALNDILEKYNYHMLSPQAHRNHTLPTESASSITGVNSGIQIQTTLKGLLSAANEFKAKLNAHVSDVTMHIAPSTQSFIPDATDLPSLITLLNSLPGVYDIHRRDADKTAGWSYHSATDPTSSDVPTAYLIADGFGLRSDADVLTVAEELTALIKLFNLHDGSAPPHGGLGFLHQSPDSPPTYGGYLYGFVYSYVYNVGSLQFENESFVTLIQVDTATPNEDPQLITNIPVLANTSGSNWDLTNTKIKIFRSLINDTNLVYLDEITNGTTSYTDNTSDVSLTNNGGASIYTSGGVIANDIVPNAKFVHVLGDVGYWANSVQNGIAYPNRINQSIPGSPDSCPGSFFVDLPQECVGFSSTSSNPIAWTANSVYRLEGQFDEKGNGSIQAISISDEVGLAASYSPVQTDTGIYFFGNDGLYFTNGYSVQRISRDWLTSYENLIATDVKASQIQGALDRLNKRVWWGTAVGSGDNDQTLVLDLNQPPSANWVVTTRSGGSNFSPSSLCSFKNKITHGDSRGYVLTHDPELPYDIKIDTAVSPSLWKKNAIVYDFISSGLDFGTNTVKKIVNLVLLKAKNLGNLSLQVIGINDDGKSVGSCTPIRSRKAVGTGLIEEKRHFPSGSLRCQSKQIQLTNAIVVITSSDTLGLAAVDSSAKTVTLASGTWPLDLDQQTISFVSDEYTNEFTILSQSGAVLTVSDPSNLLPTSGSYKWEVSGIPKDEFAQIINFVLFYEFLGTEQTSAIGESGANK